MKRKYVSVFLAILTSWQIGLGADKKQNTSHGIGNGRAEADHQNSLHSLDKDSRGIYLKDGIFKRIDRVHRWPNLALMKLEHLQKNNQSRFFVIVDWLTEINNHYELTTEGELNHRQKLSVQLVQEMIRTMPSYVIENSRAEVSDSIHSDLADHLISNIFVGVPDEKGPIEILGIPLNGTLGYRLNDPNTGPQFIDRYLKYSNLILEISSFGHLSRQMPVAEKLSFISELQRISSILQLLAFRAAYYDIPLNFKGADSTKGIEALVQSQSQEEILEKFKQAIIDFEVQIRRKLIADQFFPTPNSWEPLPWTRIAKLLDPNHKMKSHPAEKELLRQLDLYQKMSTEEKARFGADYEFELLKSYLRSAAQLNYNFETDGVVGESGKSVTGWIKASPFSGRPDFPHWIIGKPRACKDTIRGKK